MHLGQHPWTIRSTDTDKQEGEKMPQRLGQGVYLHIFIAWGMPFPDIEDKERKGKRNGLALATYQGQSPGMTMFIWPVSAAREIHPHKTGKACRSLPHRLASRRPRYSGDVMDCLMVDYPRIRGKRAHPMSPGPRRNGMLDEGSTPCFWGVDWPGERGLMERVRTGNPPGLNGSHRGKRRCRSTPDEPSG